MTFGFQATSADGSEQVNVTNSLYECIYSGVVSGNTRIVGLRSSDIISLTYLYGSYPSWTGPFRHAGGAYQHTYPNNFIFFGEHRLLVFRDRASIPRSPPAFGMELTDGGGNVVFDSSGKMLIFNNNATYKSLIFQGSSAYVGRRYGDNDDHYFHIQTTYVAPTGPVRSADFNTGAWWSQVIPPGFSISAPSLIIEASPIPMSFSMGLISQAAGIGLQPVTNPLN